MPQKIKKGKSFKVNVVHEGDTPNIYVRKPNKGGELYAKVRIRPDGKIEVRRFLEDKHIGFFISKGGKVAAREYEEAMNDSETEVVEG